MKKLKFAERGRLAKLFQKPTSAVILASFYTNIGETWLSDEKENETGIIMVGNNYYIGGQDLDGKTADFIMEEMKRQESLVSYITPQNPSMISFLDRYFETYYKQNSNQDSNQSTKQNSNQCACNQKNSQYSIIKSERHLMDIDMSCINHEMLRHYVDEVLEGYQLKPIDYELFEFARNEDKYLNNFIKLFPDYDEFKKNGFGFFMMDGTTVIAGISSYARYESGVEVQIAVMPEYRGQHLARALGAAFVLECDKRKLYPWWDCANPVSEHIAVELGYVLKQVTTIYKISNTPGR